MSYHSIASLQAKAEAANLRCMAADAALHPFGIPHADGAAHAAHAAHSARKAHIAASDAAIDAVANSIDYVAIDAAQRAEQKRIADMKIAHQKKIADGVYDDLSRDTYDVYVSEPCCACHDPTSAAVFAVGSRYVARVPSDAAPGVLHSHHTFVDKTIDASTLPSRIGRAC